jgi:basic membrane protein A and related proteins
MLRKVACVACLVLVMLTTLPLGGCNNGSGRRVLNVALLLGSGGLGDRSFNDSAYSGLLEAQKKYNIRFEIINPGPAETILESLRLFAQKDYDLIIGVAFENMGYIQTVAQEYPGVKFGEIDAELKAQNVASIVYREQEGDFLMGVLAAMLTKTKSVGVIGGTDIPAIQRIMTGFKQGVAYQDPTVKVFTDFAGTFSDSQVGYNLALKRYQEGADVIHNAASRTGLGIIQAAQETGKLTTGTSGDQRYLAPGHVVGNRPKRVDTAVLLLIDEVERGVYQAGVRSLGLKENGLSLGPFDESLVSKVMLARLDELQKKIIAGQIVVQAG